MLHCCRPESLIFTFYTPADKLLWQKGYIGKHYPTLPLITGALNWPSLFFHPPLSMDIFLMNLFLIGCPLLVICSTGSVSQSRVVIGQGWRVKGWVSISLCHCDSGSSVHLAVWLLQLPLYSISPKPPSYITWLLIAVSFSTFWESTPFRFFVSDFVGCCVVMIFNEKRDM